MFFLLAIPIRWAMEWYPPVERQIQIEIDNTPQPLPVPPPEEIIEEVIEPPIEEVIPEPIIDPAETQPAPAPTPTEITEPVTEPTTQPAPQPVEQPVLEQVMEQPTEQTTEQPAETNINSGIIFNSIQNIDKDISISEDFMAAPADTENFKPRQWQSTDFQADVPFVNSETDKPRVEMDFYSHGVLGSVERFFDKITIEKEFTTKYGTKIKCAMVGILMACSWK